MKEISFDRPEKTEEELATPPARERSRGSLKAPPLRTFGRDVESLVQTTGITKTQAVMAEASRRESRGESRTVHDDDSHLTLIIFILLLVLAFGVGVGLYVLIGVNKKTALTENIAQEKTERMFEVNIAKSPREQIIADIGVAFSKSSYNTNESRVVAFVTVDDVTKNMRDANAGELLRAITMSPIPDMLQRALGETSVLRVHGKTITDPLIGSIEFSIRSYPNAFLGMLEWEKTIARDLISILDPKFSRTTILGLTGRQFVDERVGSTNIRVLRTIDEQAVLAYMFLDNERLIIARNDEILDLIINEQVPKTTN